MIKDKLKKITNPEGDGSNKKKIENLVVFVIILIITIIIINSIWNKENTNDEVTNTANKKLATETVQTNQTSTNENSNDLEQKLANILKSIDGVGDVNVFVNYKESSTVEAMYNENTKTSSTEETDTEGRC